MRPEGQHTARGGDANGAATAAPGAPVMTAFVYERYGPPETLRVAQVDKPAPVAGEVLVKVLATSVNAADWHCLRGKPYFARATLGLRRPKHRILGVDIAGQVKAVGSGVTRFKPGDEVYANLLGDGFGGFAEYVSAPVDVVSVKPAKPVVRGSRCGSDGGADRAAGPSPPRRNPARAEGADQRGFRWCRQLRGPDRRVVRGRGDRGDQHPEHRPGPFARRGSRRGLHDDRLRSQRAALRPHPGHG